MEGKIFRRMPLPAAAGLVLGPVLVGFLARVPMPVAAYAGARAQYAAHGDELPATAVQAPDVARADGLVRAAGSLRVGAGTACTVLTLAARGEREEVRREALEHKRPRIRRRALGRGGLAISTARLAAQSVEQPLRAGAGVNVGNADSVTPLASALQLEGSLSARTFLAAAADPKREDWRGITRIRVVALSASTDLTRERIEHGAYPNSLDAQTRSTIFIGLLGRRLDAARVLAAQREIDASQPTQDGTTVFWAQLAAYESIARNLDQCRGRD